MLRHWFSHERWGGGGRSGDLETGQDKSGVGEAFMKNRSDQKKMEYDFNKYLFTCDDLIKLYGFRSKFCYPSESASLCKPFIISTWDE